MEKKKIKAGLFLSAISAVLAIAGAVAYIVNCRTSYYAKMGMNPAVTGCVLAAVVIQAVWLFLGMKGQKQWMDILTVFACVLLMAGSVLLIGTRVESAATILTYEKNASNVADLTSALVGAGCCLAATVVSIVSAFFDITAEE